MKHLRTQETSGALLISFLIYYLVFAPIVFDINLAQSLDTTPPVLAHHPAKMGYLGKSLRLTAHVADLSDIESVTMTINYAGKTVTGNVPPKKGIGDVPVLVQAINNLDVRGGPGSRYKLRGNVRNGEQLAVTGIKGEHYRIRSSRNVTGFV